MQSVLITSSVVIEYRSWWGVLNTTLCDQVCQRLAADWFFSGFLHQQKLTTTI
jgi:hypothetical protein